MSLAEYCECAELDERCVGDCVDGAMSARAVAAAQVARVSAAGAETPLVVDCGRALAVQAFVVSSGPSRDMANPPPPPTTSDCDRPCTTGFGPLGDVVPVDNLCQGRVLVGCDGTWPCVEATTAEASGANAALAPLAELGAAARVSGASATASVPVAIGDVVSAEDGSTHVGGVSASVSAGDARAVAGAVRRQERYFRRAQWLSTAREDKIV